MELLLFADDIILTGTSMIDLQDKLNTLKEYLTLNGLEINTSKTKIVIFKKGGRTKREAMVRCGDEIIQVVNEYQYLGVPFRSTGRFGVAADYFVSRARSALGVTWRVLAKSRADTWETRMRLFTSIVEATLLYAVPVWGLQHMEQLESVQNRFLKMLLGLSMSTPGYMIRVETGVRRLGLRITKQCLGFWQRILDMPESRYPRRAYEQLVQLDSRNENLPAAYNWCAQLRTRLEDIGFGFVWASQHPDTVRTQSEAILETLYEITSGEDIRRVEESTYNTEYKHLRSSLPDPEEYLMFRLPVGFMRVMAQLRLRGLQGYTYSMNGNSTKIMENERCLVCNLDKDETVQHVLCECPVYAAYRSFYLCDRSYSECLCVKSPDELRSVVYFLQSSLRLRAFCLNE